MPLFDEKTILSIHATNQLATSFSVEETKLLKLQEKGGQGMKFPPSRIMQTI